MNTEQGFTLHPGAAQDITDIWEFIVEDNPLAARRVREDILDAVGKLMPFFIQASLTIAVGFRVELGSPRRTLDANRRNSS
jgi:ParE toxin of type II toxin-antitoxin system, parDE